VIVVIIGDIGHCLENGMAGIERLEDSSIKAYKPNQKIKILNDGGGLFLYVRPSGKKSWVFIRKLDGKRIEIAIGLYPDKSLGIDPGVSLRAARIKAAELRQQVQSGTNPIEDAREKAEAEKREALRKERELERPQTIKDLFIRWKTAELEHSLDEDEVILRQGRTDEGDSIERMFDKDVFPIIGSLHPLNVDTDHMFMIRDKMMTRGVGRLTNQCLSNMRQMFVYAFRRKYIAADPTYGIKIKEFGGMQAEQPCERWLKDDEISDLAERLWKKHPGCNPYKRENQLALLLLLSTACRIGEVILSRWEDVHLEERTWHFPKAIRKSNKNYPAKDHDIYLSDLSIKLLLELKRFTGDSIFLFPSDNLPRGINPKKRTRPKKGVRIDDEERFIDPTSITKQVNARVGGETLSRRAKGNETFLLTGGTWTPHDLRRTASTLVTRLATKQKLSSPEIMADKILSHVSPNKMQRVYGKYEYDEEMKTGWELLNEHLMKIVPSHVLEPWPISKKVEALLARRKEKRIAREAKKAKQKMEIRNAVAA